MEKLLHFSFADTHRTLVVLFSSSRCENWYFLGHCCPLLRTTSCGRGCTVGGYQGDGAEREKWGHPKP